MTRILFMGSDPIAIPLLETLRDHPDVELSSILTQPDRPSGRGKKLRPNAIKAWALDHGLDIRDPEKPSEVEIEWVQDQQIELSLVMAYGHILKKKLLDTPPGGSWNFHASLLPKHRGASPIESAILAGDSETGVSLMQIIPKMDAGPVLDVERVLITEEDTSPTLREKLSQACCPLISRNLPQLLDGTANPTSQDESQVTYCSKIHKSHGQLDFTKTAQQIHQQVRAYTPWPGSYFDLNDIRIKVAQPQVLTSPTSASPGTILQADASGLQVATSEGTINFQQLQRPGGKMLPAADFFRGFEISVGLGILRMET